MRKNDTRQESPGARIYDRLYNFFRLFTWGLPVVFLFTKHYWWILWHFVICFLIPVLACLNREYRQEQGVSMDKTFAAYLKNKIAAVILVPVFRFVLAPSLAANALTWLLLFPCGVAKSYVKNYEKIKKAVDEAEQEKKDS